MLLQTCKTGEPIPGYTIIERIGAGGYGEVWRADAPGGLTKAIKFVYGFLSDQRAANELKALNRIKDVRHPFLLSLERIEVVDGQLMIVTELADASLKDRSEECRSAHLPGIPREELLVYLGDAADALDFMSQRHQLQHLDVKPENLLLVGGRVKVADFGLVKDMVATSVSMMGGMTPVYAAPELFDGQPSAFSDQYALAIVYQELLTGRLPFPGRTAAQLAKQHAGSAPQLSPLPSADRPVIARSLAKDPRQRFPSCRELVDHLRHACAAADRAAAAPAADVDANDANADTTSVAAKETQPVDLPGPASARVKPVAADGSSTMVFSRAGGSARSARPAARLPAMPFPQAAGAPAVDLPPIALAGQDGSLRPTLLVGVGGAAARVLGHLQHRLNDRFGNRHDVPALGMLLLDTDAASLCRAASAGPEGAALTASETLPILLRRPQEYRCRSEKLLRWLSRRWLYNIPRSLKTEGLRPLGRLALVDRADEVYEWLQRAVAAVLERSAIDASAKKTGLPFQEGLRVYLVASISGGTGSGMVLDLAYLVRKVLAERSLADASLCGILLHGTPRTVGASDLAEANALACLAELCQFSHPDGAYPGEPACGLAPASGAPGTFDDTYVVHLGRQMTEASFDSATRDVAEYLYINCATAAGRFFETCRQLQHAEPDAKEAAPSVRTFGIGQIGLARADLLADVVGQLCQDVAERWLGEFEPAQRENADSTAPAAGILWQPGSTSPHPRELEVDRLAEAKMASLKMQIQDLVGALGGVAERHLGRAPDAFFAALLQQMAARRDHDPDVAPATWALRTIEAIIGRPTGDEPLESAPGSPFIATPLDAQLQRHVDQQIQDLGAELSQWLLGLTDQVGARVAASARAARWLAEHLHKLELVATDQLQKLVPKRTAQARVIVELGRRPETRADGPSFDPRGNPNDELTRALLQIASWSVETAVLHAACRLAQALRVHVATITKKLRDVKGEVQRLAESFTLTVPADGQQAAAEAKGRDLVEQSITESLDRRMPELACLVDERLQAEFMNPAGGLCAVLTGNLQRRAKLPEALRKTARSVLLDALSQIDLVGPLLASAESAEPADESGRGLPGLVRAARPRLANCGGFRRLLLAAADNQSNSALCQAIEKIEEAQPSLVCHPDPNLTLCCETERMPLPQVAAGLVDYQDGVLDIAARLHTRMDVSWSPLLAGTAARQT